MMKNIVAGCVLAVLIILGLLAAAQQSEGCVLGRSVKTFKHCGSVSPSI
jgi:hypothetical protein